MDARSLLLTVFIALTGCQGPDSISGGSAASARSGASDFSFWTLDMSQPIMTGDESYAQSANIIKQCANDSGGSPLICYDVCISRWFPQNRRYSLYLSGYVRTNRCFVTILETPRHDGASAGYEFFDGVYQTYLANGVTRAMCSGIDEGVPDEQATHAFSTYWTPVGQATANPWGYRMYDLLSIFSITGRTLTSSMYLQSWQTTEGNLVNPSRFSYFEANTSGDQLTFTQMSGFGCVHRNEIKNVVIQSFQPGQ